MAACRQDILVGDGIAIGRMVRSWGVEVTLVVWLPSAPYLKVQVPAVCIESCNWPRLN